MESQKTVILGYNALPYYPHKPLPNATDDDRMKYFSSKTNVNGRLLLVLIQYLQQYTEHFDRINVVMNYELDRIWRNGTLEGLFKKLNHSEIDIGVIPVYMDKYPIDAVDFAYPYKLEDYTFVTRKPIYKPHIFGIFQMFSLPLWITIILVLMMMPLVSYSVLKREYKFNTISLSVFAILMKQNSLITPTKLVEKILVYSWVVGAMLLCLSYDSVFLSFLTIPPINKIKTLSDLAFAVERGGYHCISNLHSGISDFLNNSNQEHLRLIATDIVNNKLSYGSPFVNFFTESQKQNLAYFLQTKFLVVLNTEKFFIPEDRFFEEMSAMMVRKGFCCKQLLVSFVHRMLSSGLYFKYASDGSFIASRALSLSDPVYEITDRKLTLTDVAPAFIFLLSGYFMSLCVFIVEILSNRKKVNFINKYQKRNLTEVSDETPV